MTITITKNCTTPPTKKEARYHIFQCYLFLEGRKPRTLNEIKIEPIAQSLDNVYQFIVEYSF